MSGERTSRPGNNHDQPRLAITNREKVFWPKGKITKGDLIDYYALMAEYILPYLQDRPQNLLRFPDGITGQSIWQRDLTNAPGWLTTAKVKVGEDQHTETRAVANNADDLLYLVNLACIEMNVWGSRRQRLDNPDYCVIDLDPGKKAPFGRVIEAAQETHRILETSEIPSFCKTSGATGLHIHIPLGPKETYETSRVLAIAVVSLVLAELTDTTTIERSLRKREEKRVYLDYLQNVRDKTMASVYSVRPLPGAPVSTPLHWSEVNSSLRPKEFTMKTIRDRLRDEGDLWQDTLKPGIDVVDALDSLDKFARRSLQKERNHRRSKNGHKSS